MSSRQKIVTLILVIFVLVVFLFALIHSRYRNKTNESNDQPTGGPLFKYPDGNSTGSSRKVSGSNSTINGRKVDQQVSTKNPSTSSNYSTRGSPEEHRTESVTHNESKSEDNTTTSVSENPTIDEENDPISNEGTTEKSVTFFMEELGGRQV